MTRTLLLGALLLLLSGCSHDRILVSAPIPLASDTHGSVAALSGSGSELLVARDDLTLEFWDLATGTRKRKVTSYDPGSSSWLAVALASGGRYATVFQNGRVRAVQLDPDRLLRDAPFKTPVALSAAISRDQSIAIVADTGSLLYRTTLGGEQPTAPQDFLVKSYDAPFNSVDVTADGSLIIGAQGTAISLYDGKTGAAVKMQAAALRSSSGKQPFIGVVRFLPDGSFAVAGMSTGELAWIDIGGKKEGIRIAGRHTSPVATIAFSADLSLGASGDMTGVVAFWDPEKGTALGKVNAGGDIRALFLSDEGDRLIAGLRDGSLTEWTLTRKR